MYAADHGLFTYIQLGLNFPRTSGASVLEVTAPSTRSIISILIATEQS